MAKVIRRDTTTSVVRNPLNEQEPVEVVRFSIVVQAVFKKTPESEIPVGAHRRAILEIPLRDLECQCPKIRLNK